MRPRRVGVPCLDRARVTVRGRGRGRVRVRVRVRFTVRVGLRVRVGDSSTAIITKHVLRSSHP